MKKNQNRFQYEFEQEMLKYVNDLKKSLREKGWWERDNTEVSQTSFLRSENSDTELGFKFEWGWYNLIHSFVHNLSQFGGSITHIRWSRKKLNLFDLFSKLVFVFSWWFDSLHPDQYLTTTLLKMLKLIFILIQHALIKI